MNIVPFDFQGVPVRVIDRDGNPWFVLADVCRVLEISNPSDAASRLDPDEKMTLDNTEGHSGQRGGAQFLTIINESGLYSLVMTSRKPEAKVFRKWVTAEVVPSVRKTGAYVAPGTDLILSAGNRAVIGGIEKAVINRALIPLQTDIAALRMQLADFKRIVDGFDQTQIAVVGYKPMLQILIGLNVPQAGRRVLVQQCSNRMRRWSLTRDTPAGSRGIVQICTVSGRYLFNLEAATEWLKFEGMAIIRAHKDRLSGQGVLNPAVLTVVPKEAAAST